MLSLYFEEQKDPQKNHQGMALYLRQILKPNLSPRVNKSLQNYCPHSHQPHHQSLRQNVMKKHLMHDGTREQNLELRG